MNKKMGLTGLGAAFFSVLAFSTQIQAQELPDGEAKDMIVGVCTACHTTRNITISSGYTQDEWAELTYTMIELDPEPRNEITSYLQSIFRPTHAAHQRWCRVTPRSALKNGLCPHWGNAPAIRRRRQTDPFGGPVNQAI